MPIFLDDAAVELDGGDLAAVLASAQRRLHPAQRVVVEVELDGQSLIGDELEARAATALEGRELRLYSANPRELAAATLEQIRQGLDGARAAQAEAVQLFQHDQPGDAMRAVGRAVEIWQIAQQGVLQASTLVGIELDKQVFEDRPISAFIDDLLGQLRNLRDLIAASDTVGLADTLGYEWPQMTDRMDRLIAAMIGWIEEA